MPALVAGALIGAAIIWLACAAPLRQPLPVTRLQMSVAPADEIGGTADARRAPHSRCRPTAGRWCFQAVRRTSVRFTCGVSISPQRRSIPGTEGGVAPFFSPDGQWVGYWSPAEIRKVPLAGGPSVRVVGKRRRVFGASWGDDDRIVFARGSGGLLDVPAAGGSRRVS